MDEVFNFRETLFFHRRRRRRRLSSAVIVVVSHRRVKFPHFDGIGEKGSLFSSLSRPSYPYIHISYRVNYISPLFDVSAVSYTHRGVFLLFLVVMVTSGGGDCRGA